MTETQSYTSVDAGKSPEQLFAERSRRLQDAIELRQPDRIPISVRFGNFLPDMVGATRQELYEDPVKMQAALEKAMLEFQPDTGSGMWGSPGPSRALGDRSTKWPGYNAGPNTSYQYHEHEFMKAEDYDAFLADPADFGIRTFLPRVFGELEAFSMLPPLGMTCLGYYAVLQWANLFADPAMIKALQALLEAGRLQMEWVQQQIESRNRLNALGFANFDIMGGVLLAAPFDFMSDTLRGMRGIFLDVRRNPDKLLAAQEKLIPMMVETAVASCKARGSNHAFFPLHRGSDGFIALPVFERFYWPQLKTLMLQLIERDIKPVVFYEGVWDQRLKYLAELPKGKTIGMFQASDMAKVKEAVGDVMCIIGGMPVSMLIGSSVEEVRAKTKDVCRTVGKGGGFIMANDVGELEGCKPELIKAWIDATREFGAY